MVPVYPIICRDSSSCNTWVVILPSKKYNARRKIKRVSDEQVFIANLISALVFPTGGNSIIFKYILLHIKHNLYPAIMAC